MIGKFFVTATGSQHGTYGSGLIKLAFLDQSEVVVWADFYQQWFGSAASKHTRRSSKSRTGSRAARARHGRAPAGRENRLDRQRAADKTASVRIEDDALAGGAVYELSAALGSLGKAA